jgi:malate synthase
MTAHGLRIPRWSQWRKIFSIVTCHRRISCTSSANVVADRDALISPCGGTISRAGFDNNVEVALRYTAAWLEGLGCVPIHNLMEDAATAEIARAQLWQWVHHGSLEFPDHAPIDFALFDHALATHAHRLRESTQPGASRADEAAHLLATLTHAEQLSDFPHPSRLRKARLSARISIFQGVNT